MPTMTLIRGLRGEDVSSGKPTVDLAAVTSGMQLLVDEDIPDASTDLEIANFDLDISATKAFLLIADGVLLLETNNASTPTDTLTTVANHPYDYHENDYQAIIFTADITALFATNSSGGTVNLKVWGITDPTP